MNKLEQKRFDRKNIILSEAKQLIIKRGISEGLMSEIAKASGISRQRLYVYYKNINEILYHIMHSIYDSSFVGKIAESTESNPINVITFSIYAFPHFSDEVHDNLLFLTLFDVYLATNVSEDNRHRGEKKIALYEKQISDGQTQGIFRTDKSLEELTSTVTIMLTGFLYRSETLTKSDQEKILSPEILKHLSNMIINYLCNR